MYFLSKPENLMTKKINKNIVYCRTRLKKQLNGCEIYEKKFVFLIICASGGLLEEKHLKTCIGLLQKGLKLNARQQRDSRVNELCLVYPRLFTASLCKKPIGVRMGKGKGGIDKLVLPVKAGQILFSIRRGVDYGSIKNVVDQLRYKLPINIEIIKRQNESS